MCSLSFASKRYSRSLQIAHTSAAIRWNSSNDIASLDIYYSLHSAKPCNLCSELRDYLSMLTDSSLFNDLLLIFTQSNQDQLRQESVLVGVSLNQPSSLMIHYLLWQSMDEIAQSRCEDECFINPLHILLVAISSNSFNGAHLFTASLGFACLYEYSTAIYSRLRSPGRKNSTDTWMLAGGRRFT